MASLNRLDQVVSGVVHTSEDLCVTLGIGSPLYNDLIKTVRLFEITASSLVGHSNSHREALPDISANFFDVVPACLATLNHVISALFLISSDKVRVVDTRQRLHFRHFFLDQVFQSGFEHSGPVHGLGQVHATDIPSANHKVVRMNHGQDITERNVDLLASLHLGTQLHSGCHDNRTIVIRSLLFFSSIPDKPTAISNDARGDGSAIISAPPNKHHAYFSHLAFDLEVVDGFLWCSDVLSVPSLGNRRCTVDIFALDLVVCIHHVGGFNGEEVFTLACHSCVSFTVAEFIDAFCVRSHLAS